MRRLSGIASRSRRVSMESHRRLMRLRRNAGRVGLYVLTGLFLVFMLLPVYQMIATAFKPEAEVWRVPPTFFPHEWTLNNFVTMFQIVPGLPRNLLNSFIYGTGVAALSLLIAIPGAYGLSRFRLPGRGLIQMVLIYANMVAPIMLAVPIYTILRTMGLTNTGWGMVFAGCIFTLPLSVMLLHAYFETVPREIEEAAFVDGSNRWHALWSVVLPMATPAIVSVGVYAFITGWSQQFVLALVLIQDSDLMPVTQGLYGFFSRSSVSWPELMAASTVSGFIPMLLFVVFQRYIVRGLTAGSVKM